MYVWRDPRRCTPARLTELALMDDADPRHTEKLARMARFRQHRAAGMSIAKAAHAVGVSTWTGQQYQLQIDAEHDRWRNRRTS